MSKQYSVTAVLLLFLATFAEAAIHDKDTVDGYDCAGDMTTSNCFGPTPTSTGPTMTACVASSANNQKCRDCMVAYDIWGQEQNYRTCNYVGRSAACDCTPVGSSHCTGNTASTCTYSL